MADLIERLRLLEQDHEPDGWPAVRMRDITALLDALEAAREGWQPIETAPRDGRTILVYGTPTNLVLDGDKLVWYEKPGVHTAQWDLIDDAFCLTGGSWLGPFIHPLHWMPTPTPPQDAST